MSEQKEKFHAATEPPEKAPSAEVQPADIRELEIIAQRVGGDFGMTVKVGESGGGSYFDPHACSITFDPEHINKNPDMAKFVAGHEGAHRAITPGPKKLGLTAEQAQAYYGQVGFGYLQNIIEDGAVNTELEKDYPGLQEPIKKVYDDMFREENAILATPEVEKITQRLGYQPKFAQCGSEYLRHLYQQRFSRILDPLVEKTLTRTIKHAEDAMATLPDSMHADEQQIITKGQERFQDTTEYIWPEFKKLVEEDLHTEELRQMINQPDIFEQLPPELKEGLRQVIEEAVKDQTQTKQPESGEIQTPAEQPESLSAKDSAMPPELPLPQEKLPPEIKKGLEEVLRSLPRKQRQELQQKAQKELEKIEDALNKELGGKLNQDKPISHSEQHQQEQDKEQAAAQVEAKKLEQEKIKKELELQRQAAMAPYERTRAEVVGQINDLYLRLRRLLKPEEYGAEEMGFPSGQRLDVNRAMQAEQDPEQKHKLFIREQAPERRDYRFWHLVDLSGSMAGEKINETFKGFVIAGEALDRVESLNSDTITIHQGITGFHNRIFEYKALNQRFSPDIENQLATMPSRTEDADSGTNTFKASQAAVEKVKANLGSTGNYILTYTDGEPNHDVREKLATMLQDSKAERNRLKIKVGLIWLGEKQDEASLQKLVKEYGYDFGLAMSAVKPQPGEIRKTFAESLANLLEDIVNHPEKY